MVQLVLTAEEATLLGEILASYLSDLRMEIADTEAMDFREALKQREVFLKKLLHTLSQEQVSKSPVP
jgi:predicted Zn-dependent protease